MFLLDTDHLSIMQRRTEPECSRLRQRMFPYGIDDFAISVVTVHEQMMGANSYISHSKGRESILRGYEMIKQCLEDVERFLVLPFDESAALEFDRQRHAGVRIGPMDLRIACIALSRGLTVLTRNVVDFQEVIGLKVEDWTQPS